MPLIDEGSCITHIHVHVSLLFLRYAELLRELKLQKEQAEKELQEQRWLEELKKKEVEDSSREIENEGSGVQDFRPRSMTEEVNAALFEFDQMLDNHIEALVLPEHTRGGVSTGDDHTRNSHHELSVSPLPASSVNSSSSDISLTHPSPSPQNSIVFVQPKGNVKGIINQMHLRSVSPSPPTSPSSPKPLPLDIIHSKANVKDLVNQIQHKSVPRSTSTSPHPPSSSRSLASERISRFLEENNKRSMVETTKDKSVNIGKIRSPFLSDNKQIAPPPTMIKPLKKSMSHDDILQETEPCDSQVLNGEKSHDKKEDTVSKCASHPEISECESHDNHMTNKDQMNTLNKSGSSSILSGNASVELSRSHDNILVPTSDLQPEEKNDAGVDTDPVDKETFEPNDQSEVFSSPSDASKSKRPLRRAGGPMERKFVTRRTPRSSLSGTCNVKEGGGEIGDNDKVKDFSDEEMEVGLPFNPETTHAKEVRSKSALPSHSQSLNVPNPRLQSQASTKSRREIRSVGDTGEVVTRGDGQPEEEVERELPFQQSSELTMDMSMDTFYHLNYQLRHSIDCDSSDSVGRYATLSLVNILVYFQFMILNTFDNNRLISFRSDESSPSSSEKDRFIVNKKRWGKKSPVKSLKGQRKDNTHPLFSKIHRIGSPMSSGESGSSTPVLGTSPKKLQKSRSRNGT